MHAADDSRPGNTLKAFFLDRDAILALPAFSRASASVAAMIAIFLFIACGLISLALLVRLGWDALSSPDTSYQEYAKNFLLAFVSVFGAPFLAWRTWVAHHQANAAARQASVALENHITGIFSKSVELLGQVREVKTVGADGSSVSRSAANIEARLGALFSLEHLLSESKKDQRAVLETLCAYVRENSPLELPQDKDERDKYFQGVSIPTPTRRSDVQAAITIVGRRPSQVRQRADAEGWRLDFRDSNLVGYDFTGLSFNRSDFSGSFLNLATLDRASFENSIFENSVLCQAKLNETSFQTSHFKHCNVKAAKIDAANFKDTKIENTDLREATISSLDISGADLKNAFGNFLEFVVNHVQQNGTAGPYEAQEILKTEAFFRKARHDDQTEVSQAVVDAIEIMKAGTASTALPARRGQVPE